MSRKKPYWIKYKTFYNWTLLNKSFDWLFTNRYKTKKAMDDALKDMKHKGHRVIETGIN